MEELLCHKRFQLLFVSLEQKGGKLSIHQFTEAEEAEAKEKKQKKKNASATVGVKLGNIIVTAKWEMEKIRPVGATVSFPYDWIASLSPNCFHRVLESR